MAALATAAVVDGIKGHGDLAPAATAVEEPGGGDAAVVLAGFGARGELVLYGQGCSEQRLTLPSLAGRRVEECLPRGVASPNGELVARCAGGGIAVHRLATGDKRRQPGCAPAWRPNGTLTASYGDEVVTFRACAEPSRCAATLIGRAQDRKSTRLNSSH